MFEQVDVPDDGDGNDRELSDAAPGSVVGEASEVEGPPDAERAAKLRAAEEAARVRGLLDLLGSVLVAGMAQLRGCDPVVLAGALCGREPDVVSRAVLDSLDLGRLDAGQLLDVLKAQAGQQANAEAGQLNAVAAFAARRARENAPGGASYCGATPAPEQVSEWAAHEIEARLCLSRPSARNRVEHALDVTRRLPGTLEALQKGRIDGHRAKVIAEGTQTLDAEQSALVEARVLPRAERQNPSGLRASVQRAALRLAPELAKQRHERAVTDRQAQVYPLADGMAQLCWTDRADLVLAFSMALDSLAQLAKHGEHGAGRNMQQCRADVMADLAARLLDLDGLPSQHGARPHVSVVIPLGTALRLTDETAELIGYGPIPADLARDIVADATWQRLLTDPATGALLNVGRDKYRPPAALREHVLACDSYCQGLGCRVPARRCDLDHRVDWAHGGHTRASDLDPLCRSHHRLKHEGGWTRERQADGSTTWTTPTGHVYVRDPDLLPGAKPPLAMTASTPDHENKIREHAAMLGITLPDVGMPDQEMPSSQVRLTPNPEDDPPAAVDVDTEDPPF